MFTCPRAPGPRAPGLHTFCPSQQEMPESPTHQHNLPLTTLTPGPSSGAHCRVLGHSQGTGPAVEGLCGDRGVLVGQTRQTAERWQRFIAVSACSELLWAALWDIKEEEKNAFCATLRSCLLGQNVFVTLVKCFANTHMTSSIYTSTNPNTNTQT